MRLTPADVHNVAFKKPSIGKRGYDEDEVDAFLDLVEAELSRLIEENNELTQRLAAAQAGGFAAGAPAEQAPYQQPEAVQQYIEQAPADAQHDHEAPEAQAPVAEAPAPVVEAPVAAPAVAAEAGPAAHHVQAAKLLGLAQETAERLTGDAAAEAEATRSAAKAESEKLVTDAQNEANRLISEAQNKSDGMVNEATAKAEALERDSRIRADAMDREAQGKYTQVMGQLTEQRTTLEKKIDDLRVYEREYRSRLKSWITDQLSQLDESGAAASENSEHVTQGAE
jgi:DivIVA domain-containing protein